MRIGIECIFLLHPQYLEKFHKSKDTKKVITYTLNKLNLGLYSVFQLKLLETFELMIFTKKKTQIKGNCANFLIV